MYLWAAYVLRLARNSGFTPLRALFPDAVHCGKSEKHFNNAPLHQKRDKSANV